MRISARIALVLIAACSTVWAADKPSTGSSSGTRTPPASVADRLGSTHAAGTYNFTQGDFLNEGADRILSLGMRVIKAYLQNPGNMYPHNSQWPKFDNLVQMAGHPYYRELFKKPFSTFVLTVYAIKPSGGTSTGATACPTRSIARKRPSFTS